MTYQTCFFCEDKYPDHVSLEKGYVFICYKCYFTKYQIYGFPSLEQSHPLTSIMWLIRYSKEITNKKLIAK